MNNFAVERSESREMSWPDAPELGRAPVLVRRGDTINRVGMQRVERRIGLRLFGHWFGYESSTTQRQVETVQLTQAGAMTSIAPPAPRGQFALAGGGVLAIALLGGAIGALLVPAAPQAASGVPLLTTLPESRPIAIPETNGGRSGAVATSMRTPRPALITATPAAPAPGGTSTMETPTEAVADGSLSLAQARAAALASGEPAYWAEGTRNGVVVAGPERADNGQMCRLVAIFTRIEGDRGSTQSATQCRAGPSVPKN